MKQKPKGFTLVELVMVLVLVGILSSFAASLFATRDNYDQRIVADFVVSAVRQAQQTALARSTDNVAQLQLSNSGSEWLGRISAQGGTVHSQSMDRHTFSLHGGTDMATACSSLPSLPLQIGFDGDGGLTSGQNYRLCVPSRLEVCVSASGYAYVGSCL